MTGVARGLEPIIATVVALIVVALASPAEAASDCFRSAGYAATVRPRDGEVGEDVLSAAAKTGDAACPSTKARSLVAAGEPGDLLWLRGRYLALTYGTGTDEDLRIVDLATSTPILVTPVARLDAATTPREGMEAFDVRTVGAAIASARRPGGRGATIAGRGRPIASKRCASIPATAP